MADQSPGFYFNVEEWRGSRAVGRMSMAERGVYLEMMIEQWLRRSLPDDADAVADAIALSTAQIAEVMQAWPAVHRKFVTDASGRLVNVKLEQVRRQQRANQRKRQLAGQRGGKAAADGRRKRQTSDELQASNATAMLGTAIAIPSDKRRVEESRSDQIREEQIHQRRPSEPTSAKRPLVGFPRLCVFPWMVEQLGANLGDVAFDLGGWLLSLERDTKLVIPATQGERWRWLQAAFDYELRTRGLLAARAGDDDAILKALVAQGPSKRPYEVA